MKHNLNKFELMPLYDKRKSFYNKARIEIDQQKKLIKLYSYNTRVLEITTDNNKATLTTERGTTGTKGTHSTTTLRHIKECLKQNGFKADTKKQILEDYKSEVLQWNSILKKLERKKSKI